MGSYTKAFYENKEKWRGIYQERGKILERYIKKLSHDNRGEKVYMLEGGIGEATAMRGFKDYMDSEVNIFGFDISWSRVKCGKVFLEKEKCLDNTELFVGDLMNIPLINNLMDIVYTNHAIEPNGGNEETILKELYRVTSSYLIMFEPDYDLANEPARKRM